MAGQCPVMFGWSWTEVSVLQSQVFGPASVDSSVLEMSTLYELPLFGMIFYLMLLIDLS